MKSHQQVQALELGQIHRQLQLKTSNVPINLTQIRLKRMKMDKYLSTLRQVIIILASLQPME